MKHNKHVMNTAKSLAMAALAISLSAPALAGECTFPVTVQIDPPTCGEVADGTLDIYPTGGTEPYTYYLNSEVQAGPHITGLVAGVYDYWVNDAAGCWFKGKVELECEEEVNCQFRTQTMGGWGAPPNGGNPAMYLQNHWLACFPNGITVGCVTGNTLTLTTSTAVKHFLPSGSTGMQLTQDWVNPGGSLSNVLAGQLVAATINITVDGCDPDFGEATGWLGDVTYIGGPFDGMSVAAVIDAANQFIGGCGGSNTASEFTEALTHLNENYHNGTTDNGYFACKKEEKSITMSGPGAMRVFPNPTSDVLTVNAAFQSTGMGSIVVIDVAGRVVLQQAVNVETTGMRSISLDVQNLTSGIYTVAIVLGDNITTSRVVVNK